MANPRQGNGFARRLATACLAAAVIVAVLLGMGWLSRSMTRHHLAGEAQSRLWTLQQGLPLWHWSLRTRHDLVARKVFGHANVVETPAGLQLTSIDGSPFEVGLPVREPMDTRHWQRLAIHMETPATLRVHVIWQVTAGAPVCTSRDALFVGPGQLTLYADFDLLDGHQSDGTVCAPPDRIAWLLRLRFDMPTGTSLTLQRAELTPRQPPVVTDGVTGAALTAADDPSDGEQTQAAPLFLLPSDLSAEDWLAQRDLIQQRVPAALVVVGPATVTAQPETHGPAWPAIVACISYLFLLIVLGRRPRPRWEWLALLPGLLWLIAGLQWGQSHSVPALAAFIAALVFAIWREWQTRPHDWHWLGLTTSAWLWPLAAVFVALALLCLSPDALQTPPWRHAITYLGWATLQQWLMLGVLLPRLERAGLPRVGAWLATAAVFGLLHTPNGAVMQLCFLAELWWAACFLRSRALLPVALAHAVCALLVEAGLTGTLVRSLEVSARFFL